MDKKMEHAVEFGVDGKEIGNHFLWNSKRIPLCAALVSRGEFRAQG